MFWLRNENPYLEAVKLANSSLSQRDDYKNRKDTRYCKTKQELNTNPSKTMGATKNNEAGKYSPYIQPLLNHE